MRNLTQEMSVIPVLWPLTLSDPLSASLSFQPFLLERNHLGGTPAFWVPFQKLTVCKNTDIKCVRLYSKQVFDDMRWNTGSHKNWESQEPTQSFLHWSRMFKNKTYHCIDWHTCLYLHRKETSPNSKAHFICASTAVSARKPVLNSKYA